MTVSTKVRYSLRKASLTKSHKGNLFRMKDLVAGDPDTLKRFTDKARALQLFNDEFRFNTKPVDIETIPYLVERFLNVLKEYYNKFPGLFEDTSIMLVGTRLSLDFIGNSYTDGDKVVVIDNLRPEVVAHELGHVADLKNANRKRVAHTGAKLINHVAPVVIPILLGRLGMEPEKAKKYLGITAGVTAADLLATKYIEGRERDATNIAKDILGKTGDTSKILSKALETYNIKHRLLNSTLPGLAAGTIAGGIGATLRKVKGEKLSIPDVAGVYTSGLTLQNLLSNKFNMPQNKEGDLYRYLSDPLKI